MTRDPWAGDEDYLRAADRQALAWTDELRARIKREQAAVKQAQPRHNTNESLAEQIAARRAQITDTSERPRAGREE